MGTSRRKINGVGSAATLRFPTDTADFGVEALGGLWGEFANGGELANRAIGGSGASPHLLCPPQPTSWGQPQAHCVEPPLE